jgi:hypothetical protein
MPKRATKKKSRRRSSTAESHLWLVPFTFERPRTKQRGSFQMVVEAVSPDDAMERCHERLVELAATTALFKEPVKLYSDGLIRLTGRFNEPALLNFELPDVDGRISNLMPEQAKHDAMISSGTSMRRDRSSRSSPSASTTATTSPRCRSRIDRVYSTMWLDVFTTTVVAHAILAFASGFRDDFG